MHVLRCNFPQRLELHHDIREVQSHNKPDAFWESCDKLWLENVVDVEMQCPWCGRHVQLKQQLRICLDRHISKFRVALYAWPHNRPSNIAEDLKRSED